MADVPFDSPYRHGFVRVAVAVPRVFLADPAENARAVARLAREAHDRHAALVVFPELCLSGYTCDDIFHQEVLLDASLEGLRSVGRSTADCACPIVVGLPMRVEGRLFNVAAVVHRGRVIGVVPKSYLPSYREFYETRQFRAAREAVADTIELFGERVPFGPNLVFAADTDARFTFGIEICEDLWTPLPPSGWAALAGATLLLNLSASNVTVGKSDYRRALCEAQSARCLAAYVYTAAGAGESTTDLAWDGHAMIAENGVVLAESERFSEEPALLVAEVDLGRLAAERMRQTSWGDSVLDHGERLRTFRTVSFAWSAPTESMEPIRVAPRFPYVPAEGPMRDRRCAETYAIQVHGLEQRMRSSGLRNIVIGVSGGLDSTQALIVAARTLDRMGLPRTCLHAVTLPGFATSERTLANARALMDALGTTASEIDIRPSCLQMLRDIGHPLVDGHPVYDVTFENVQAGERTSHLFRLANHRHALVLGTGDLSELALGWCTYGVGDHMSHYNVNASVPKTLIQYLIRWEAAHGDLGAETARTLVSIAETEISPELVPGDHESDQPGQRTEERIGPYALQDFTLYHLTRYGFPPAKIVWLAENAWAGTYTRPEIVQWMELFLRRFFAHQFKRSCIPNAPKVGSGGSLSPRGDWRMPSDARVDAWIEALRRDVPIADAKT
ncbi:MAG: NAD(+) synthase [Armatimonadota bacterium]